MTRSAIGLAVLSLLLIACMPAAAQNRPGSIRGIVEDHSGLPIPGATVHLNRVGDPATAPARKVQAGADGSFEFALVAAGDYQVEVIQAGFQTWRSTVTVTSRPVRLQIRLRLSEVHEQVTVTEENPGEVSIDSSENGNYLGHSLNVQVRGRFADKVRAVLLYRYGRAYNDADGADNLPPDSYNTASEWGRSGWDRRHRLRLMGTVDLPAGFTSGLILRVESGRPYEWTTGLDTNLDGRAPSGRRV